MRRLTRFRMCGPWCACPAPLRERRPRPELTHPHPHPHPRPPSPSLTLPAAQSKRVPLYMRRKCTEEGISDEKAALKQLSSAVEAATAGSLAETHAKKAHDKAAGKFEDLRQSCAASMAYVTQRGQSALSRPFSQLPRDATRFCTVCDSRLTRARPQPPPRPVAQAFMAQSAGSTWSTPALRTTCGR